MRGQCRYQILFCLWTAVAQATVPESLESFILEKDVADDIRYTFSLQNTESLWRSEGPSASLVLDFLTDARNSFTLGYYQTTNQPDKYAYFLRYDYTFGGTQSVSLKWLHNDWNYMASAQENIALEYNAYVPVESLGTGGYFTLGIYQRWLKQSWNNNYQNPFSLDTDDTSMFLAATFGILFKVGSEGSFITIDLNNRDTFNFYNSDDVGTDLSYYWKLESENFIRLIAGTRWSGFFTFLPGYATTNYVGAAYSF